MEGAKKRLVPILIAVLFIAALVGLVFYVESRPTNYEKSFYEGMPYGEVSCVIAERFLNGYVSEYEYLVFAEGNLLCMMDPSPAHFELLNEVVDIILGDETIQISFRENTDRSAFFKGAAAKSYQISTEGYYKDGKISKEVYDLIMEKYDELIASPSNERMEEFSDIVNTYLDGIQDMPLLEGASSLAARSFNKFIIIF